MKTLHRVLLAALFVSVGFCRASFSSTIESPDQLAARVDTLVKQITPLVIEVRRDIHAHPELANREVRTARVVAEHLKRFGVDEIKTGVARTGVVALIRGAHPGPTIALRADMDALPVQEQTGLPFASQVPGVMHACGHDANTAMLLGAAGVLVQLRDLLHGNVKLIFQPAEEGTPPGEEGGAALMVKEGVLENPKVSAIFALHTTPELPTGKIGYRLGGVMASVDRFKITVTGKQSHAAEPWEGIDSILVASHIVVAAQSIASRRIDTRQPVVVSFGIINGGQAWNIIPEQVVLEGTIRSHDPSVRKQAQEELQKVATGVAEAFGAKADLQIHDYGPVVWNDPKLGQLLLPALARVVSKENLVESPPVMGGEDFAHFAAKVPGFYVFLGDRNESIGAIHPLHTPKMIVDEAVLPIGVKTHVYVVLQYLNRMRADQ